MFPCLMARRVLFSLLYRWLVDSHVCFAGTLLLCFQSSASLAVSPILLALLHSLVASEHSPHPLASWDYPALITPLPLVGLTAGLPVLCSCTKNQFAKIPRGLRRIRDHRWKALEKAHLNGGGTHFLKLFFGDLFFLTPQKLTFQNAPSPI